MGYQKWTHRDGMVLVEKYTGTVIFDDVLQNDQEALEDNQPYSGQLLVLTDVIEAMFDQVAIDQFKELLQSLDDHAAQTYGMKLAIFAGMNRFEDFQKLARYAEEAAERPFSIFVFNVIETAMTWLGIVDSERELIASQLKQGFDE